MTSELTLLTWTLLLALVQIFLSAIARTRQYGVKWNAGPRDEATPPVSPLTGRLERAQRNLFETLPLFIAAVLIADQAGRDSGLSLWGARLYFWARLIYLPLYAAGVPMVRSLVWIASLVGLLLIIVSIISPSLSPA